MKYDISKLTLEEKISLLCGKDNWRLQTANGKVKEVFLSDGPSGLRKMIADVIPTLADVNSNKFKTVPATAMPTLSTIANTWSEEMAKLDGSTIADDCIENDVDVLLAPGVNIKRTPLNGRNFEYFSEDPYLSGVMGKAFIEGVQEKGIGTSLKHFIANNREIDRCFQSSEVAERTLREIYLLPFEIALKAKPWTVMCSYNPINGIYASENKYFLHDVLRNEFGYDGVIVSDWGAVHSPYKAVKATLDLTMPYSDKFYDQMILAYNEGLITEEEIDFAVQNILTLIEKTENDKKKISFTKEERHENAVKIAKEGIVLLKNQDNILPITSGKTVVCGEEAYNPTLGGTGSAFVTTEYEQISIDKTLNDLSKGKAEFVKSKCIIRNGFYMEITDLLPLAYDCDNVLLCIGVEKMGEGYDRTSIRLSPRTEEYIREISKINPNVIVCLYSGSAIDVSPWIDCVKGLVWAGFSGQGVNEALANIIVGETSPSGKLAETLPINLEDTPFYLNNGNASVSWYNEGIFVGYRYYEKYDKPVAYPFGFGLSYANFTYSNLKIEKHGELDYTLCYDITNNSNFDAKEVSQVYVKDVFSMVLRPEKELKGFSKDLIKARSTKTISVKLDKRAFAYYNTCLKDWHVENGAFEILVGSSSKDIKLKKKIDIKLPNSEQYSSSCMRYDK
ncbi:MAG: glycoside hydrolase family 3 C-terminal domain-containing protein [Clostridia bacterium]|nr:glycoside hydrolase family 3 C-terminal domain-containing protein [Clostridia bacterium]